MEMPQQPCQGKPDGGQAPLYEIISLTHSYETAGERIQVLRDITMQIEQQETLAIVGASGSGKSSLLHLLGTLANANQGTIYFEGIDIAALSAGEKALLRNRDIGFVFQYHYMLPEFTTLENVAMPALVGGVPRREAYEQAGDLLEQVGLAHRAKYNVTLLSGGERQRAAIARAVLNGPKVLLADEPTGNLDATTGQKIIDLLLELNQRHKMAMVVVTHNMELAAQMGRCLELKSGDLYDQTR